MVYLSRIGILKSSLIDIIDVARCTGYDLDMFGVIHFYKNQSYAVRLRTNYIADYTIIFNVIANTPSIPNYKSFQKSWRVKVFQV